MSGSIWLDTLSYRLVAMTMELNHSIRPTLRRSVRVDSWDVDLLPCRR